MGFFQICRLINRQPPFCVPTMLLIFLFIIRTLLSNLRFLITAQYLVCKETFFKTTMARFIVQLLPKQNLLSIQQN